MKPLIDSDIRWLSVVGYEGLYLVSENGDIYSEPRTEFVDSSRTGGHYRFRGQCLLIPRVSKAGYQQVGLYKDGKVSRRLVHRLVAEAFIPNRYNCREVNHLDGDKLNNRYSNLEWVSRRENSLHSTRVLLKNRGESNNFSKLTVNQVLAIKEQLELGVSQTDIAKIFNVSNHAIFRIQHGYNWAWLTGYGERSDKDEASC